MSRNVGEFVTRSVAAELQEDASNNFDTIVKILFALSDIKWTILNFVKNNPGSDITTIADQIKVPTPTGIRKHLRDFAAAGFITVEAAREPIQTGKPSYLYSLAPKDIAAAIDTAQQIEVDLANKLDPQLMRKIQLFEKDRKTHNQILCICNLLLQHTELTEKSILVGLKEYFNLKDIPANHAIVVQQLVQAGILVRTLSAYNFAFIYQLSKA